MQQDKNIQQKLQQLENQQLPDLSQMDDHWQKMQGLLQPTVPTPGKVVNISRWIYGFTAAVIITAGIIYFNSQKNNDEKKIPVVTVDKTQSKKTNGIDLVKSDGTDSLSNNNIVLPKPDKSKLNNALTVTPGLLNNVNKTSIWKQNNGIINPQNTFSFSVTPETKDDTVTNLRAIIPNRQEMLEQLLGELAKKAQEFTIDNRKDTLLIGTEGSALLIPANSLGGGSGIKISLKEYYKESDIVLNKLSTTSNGQQLETGGMVHIVATENGKPIETLRPGTSICLYLPDTSSIKMKDMKLFNGVESDNGFINWIPQAQYFTNPKTITEVKVLDLRNDPYTIVETKNGRIAYFEIDDECKLTKAELKKILKNRYGYYKVKLKPSWRGGFFETAGTDQINNERNQYRGVGDSTWMEISAAKKYNLEGTATRTYQVNETKKAVTDTRLYNKLFGGWSIDLTFGKGKKLSPVPVQNNTYDSIAASSSNIYAQLNNKYSVNLNKLGWINCDRFTGRDDLIRYAVNLNDESKNYYTVLVFNNIKSMMTGFLDGNTVSFNNVPLNEPVTVICIGVNKDGETIMAIKETKTDKEILEGLIFEPVSKDELATSLSKIDK